MLAAVNVLCAIILASCACALVSIKVCIRINSYICGLRHIEYMLTTSLTGQFGESLANAIGVLNAIYNQNIIDGNKNSGGSVLRPEFLFPFIILPVAIAVSRLPVCLFVVPGRDRLEWRLLVELVGP